ncbi:hypothetical protein B0H13DRAFT_1885838 [Mycena leptocephala]|nr:hypothetical protein B0H13DRAFT_1885838 [Mycena leptocephala]
MDFAGLEHVSDWKEMVRLKFQAAILAANRNLTPPGVSATSNIRWSTSEERDFPALLLEQQGNFKPMAVQLPTKTTKQVMAYYAANYEHLSKIDILNYVANTPYLWSLFEGNHSKRRSPCSSRV